MKAYDAIVVGASVCGNRVAELLASKGYEVLVLEEHLKVGEPVKCAGLVSYRINKLVPHLPSEILINRIREASFISFRHSFSLRSKKPFFVLDRKKLDEYLFCRAEEAGAHFKLGEKFKKLKHEKNSLTILADHGSYVAKLLIGADGAISDVAREACIPQIKKYLMGVQAKVKGNFDPSCVELWFSSKFSKDFFGWVVPENEDVARVGIASSQAVLFHFKNFLRKRVGKNVKPDFLAPISFGVGSSIADRVLLVGDAACMTKPFSGGGIVYGLIGSECCGEACEKALESNAFNYAYLKASYERIWKAKLSHAIKKGFLLRKILNLKDFRLDILFGFLSTTQTFKLLRMLDVDLF